MLSKRCVNPNSNTFGRSCIIILNRIGAITEPCGIPISIVLFDEYVLPTRVQIHLSDKKFFLNIETSYHMLRHMLRQWGPVALLLRNN